MYIENEQKAKLISDFRRDDCLKIQRHSLLSTYLLFYKLDYINVGVNNIVVGVNNIVVIVNNINVGVNNIVVIANNIIVRVNNIVVIVNNIIVRVNNIIVIVNFRKNNKGIFSF